MPMISDWLGKTAVITGWATGIGFAMAHALTKGGVDVALASRNPEKLEKAVAALRENGRRAIAIPCDVADRAQVYALAERVSAELGPVDFLFANAGVTTAGRFLDHTDQDWDWAIDINFRGMTHCIQAFYPAMAKRGVGAILMTGSQTGFSPDWIRSHGPYVPSKAAVLALTLALRMEAAEFGVKVSALIPAATTTELGKSMRKVSQGVDAHIKPYKGRPEITERLSSDEVVARALAGLKSNAAIIATHADMKPLVEDYCRRILAAYDAAAAFKG